MRVDVTKIFEQFSGACSTHAKQLSELELETGERKIEQKNAKKREVCRGWKVNEWDIGTYYETDKDGKKWKNFET